MIGRATLTFCEDDDRRIARLLSTVVDLGIEVVATLDSWKTCESCSAYRARR